MVTTLIIHDETALGAKTASRTLDFLTDTITVRELIRGRIYEEVRDYNSQSTEIFHGLVQPTDTELTLNGFRVREHRKVNWETQFEKAIHAFETNGFFILVDDKQVESLDETITIRPETQVSFIKLVPLVGG